MGKICVCRMCLAVDIKMYHKSQQKLDIMYSDVCGINILPNERIPEMICWECAARLRSAHKLKEKARTAHDFLLELASKSTIATVEDTQFVNTFQHNLKSTLTKQYFNEHYDVIVQDDVIEELEEEFNFDDSNDVCLSDTPLLSNEILPEPTKIVNTSKDITASKLSVSNTILNVTHEIDNGRKTINHSNDLSSKNIDDINKNFVGDDNDELKNKLNVDVLKMENWMELLIKRVPVAEKTVKIETLSANIKFEEEINEDSSNLFHKKRKNKLQESEDNVSRADITRIDDKAVKIDDTENISTINNCNNDNKISKKLKLVKLRKVTDAEKEALEAAKKVVKVIKVPEVINEDIGVGPDASHIRQIFALGKNAEVVDLKEVCGVKDIGLKKEIVGTNKQITGVMKKIEKFIRKKKLKTQNRIGGPKKAFIDEGMFTITTLSLEEQIMSVQKRQESAAYIGFAYKCPLCYTGFSQKAALEAHSLKHNDVNRHFECFVCKIRFSSVKLMRRHSVKHKNQYTCNICDFVTYAKMSARAHQRCHNGQKYTCQHCGQVFLKSPTYFLHLRSKHPSKYVCELCGYTFVSEKGILVHKKWKHADMVNIRLEGPPCEACNVKQFLNKIAYKRHLLVSSVHTSEESFRKITNDDHCVKRSLVKNQKPKLIEFSCELCDEKIIGNFKYNLHFKHHHPGHNRTQFASGGRMCEECGKVFTYMGSFRHHKHRHSSLFRCKRCGKTFATEVLLEQHRVTHKPVKTRVICDHCKNQFSSKDALQRHIKTVHMGLRQYQCPICKKFLTTQANLKKHVVHVHDGEPRPRKERSRRRPRTIKVEIPDPLDISGYISGNEEVS